MAGWSFPCGCFGVRGKERKREEGDGWGGETHRYRGTEGEWDIQNTHKDIHMEHAHIKTDIQNTHIQRQTYRTHVKTDIENTQT